MKTKQFYFGMFMAVIAMAFAACSSSDEAQNEQETTLQFSGSYDALVAPQEIDPWGYELLEDSLEGTLSKVSKFMLDEEVKTRAPQDNTWTNMSDRNLSVMVGGSVYKYSVAANGAITSSTPYYFTTTGNVGVSAWYPYSASLGSFSVQANQSMAANYEKSCLLYATQTVNHGGSSNSLVFSHKTAKLVITCIFTGVKYVLNSTFNSLKINGAKIMGTVSNGSITGTSGSATQITAFCSRASSTSGDVTTATFECSIIPQTAELTLSIDDGGVIYTGVIPSRAYEANTIYTATVNMDATPVAVDLGLPSGTKWADRNVGAHAYYDDGGYYQWGARTPAEAYYGSTENITIESGHDTAYENWGNPWRMPSPAEFSELTSNCTITNITQNGRVLFIFKSKINGDSIIFSKGESNGIYWTNYPTSEERADDYWIRTDDYHKVGNYYKSSRRQVRPVCD